MQNINFLPYPHRLYSITAIASLFLLVAAFIHKGSDGPFGPTLDQLQFSDASAARLGQDVFEIVYFGSTDCEKCETWKKTHLPRWRQAALSRDVHLTMRSAYCGNATKYASLCRKLVDDTTDQPVFALIHWETGRVLATGRGVSGFYSVGKQARKWQKTWSDQQNTV